MQGQCSVGQGLPTLHEVSCGWVFQTVASNLEAAPGSPQRQHGGGPLVVSCGQNKNFSKNFARVKIAYVKFLLLWRRMSCHRCVPRLVKAC